MKTNHSDLDQRYLLLFKLDAKNLFDRVYNRKNEYIEVFSLKRNRSVFRDIFSTRYEKASISDLSHCPLEVIETLDQFYNYADEIYWYLKHTQDMPNTIEDEVIRRLNTLKIYYETLSLYVDAVLSGDSEEPLEIDAFEELSPVDSHDDSFVMEGEKQLQAEEDEFIPTEQYPDSDLQEESVDSDNNANEN